MSQNITKLINTILSFSKNIDQNFVKLSELFFQLRLKDPQQFQAVVVSADIDKRKAYYMSEIGGHIDRVAIPPSALHDIGWTKVQIIARHLSTDNWEALLELASRHTVRDLKLLMQGIKPMETTKTILLSLSLNDHKRLVAVLIKHGASRSGSGHANKETALMKMVDKVMEKGGDADWTAIQ